MGKSNKGTVKEAGKNVLKIALKKYGFKAASKILGVGGMLLNTQNVTAGQNIESQSDFNNMYPDIDQGSSDGGPLPYPTQTPDLNLTTLKK